MSKQTLNVAAPDSNTNYFVQPYYLQPGGEIDVHGAYPFNRYFSFITYQPGPAADLRQRRAVHPRSALPADRRPAGGGVGARPVERQAGR